MSTQNYFSFKEMCDKFSVTPRTLRYYEYIELITPERKGRTRLYGPREVARMTLIMRGRRFGFSLEDIRQWLLIYDTEGLHEQVQTFLKAAVNQKNVLDAQCRELQSVISELDSLIEKLRASS